MGSHKGSSRTFTTGSRDTPDICDQFLQKLGYYRKHTPQDSANLFRVVSEQHYGIQLYHQRVRTDCIEYMRENPTLFPEISGPGFHHYLTTLASPFTVGTKLELRALALLHRANVQTFEPFAGGTWFVNNQDNNEVWHVFIGRDKSFDTVYTLKYMENLAYCQALVYELLYVDVLKLPDVAYATERMLYDPHGRSTKYSKNENDEDVAITADGRSIVLSTKRDETECVLHNFRFCNFHNSENFASIAMFFRSHWRTDPHSNRSRGCVSRTRHTTRKPDPLLYDRNISCVRQLLAAGITPFPYKTAKSLDPHMYRNGEYDAWIEEAKLSGSTINKAPLFKIGSKCFAKIRGVYKFCRIERIIAEKQLLMVRLNAHSVECVAYNDVTNVSVMRSADYAQRKWALWNGQMHSGSVNHATNAAEPTPVDNNFATDKEKVIENFEALDILQQQQIFPEGGLFTPYYPFQYHLIPPPQYDLMASMHQGPPVFNMGMLPESTLPPPSTSGEPFVGNPNLVPNYCYAGLAPFHTLPGMQPPQLSQYSMHQHQMSPQHQPPPSSQQHTQPMQLLNHHQQSFDAKPQEEIPQPLLPPQYSHLFPPPAQNCVGQSYFFDIMPPSDAAVHHHHRHPSFQHAVAIAPQTTQIVPSLSSPILQQQFFHAVDNDSVFYASGSKATDQDNAHRLNTENHANINHVN